MFEEPRLENGWFLCSSHSWLLRNGLDSPFCLLSPFLFLLFSHIDFQLCFSAPMASMLLLRAGCCVTLKSPKAALNRGNQREPEQRRPVAEAP